MASVFSDLADRDVVDDRRGVRQQFADPRPALAVLGELEDRRRTGNDFCPDVIPVIRWPMRILAGNSVPFSFCSAGL